MKKSGCHLYAPHLAIRDFSVPCGREWLPKLSGWALIQIKSGVGYWMQAQTSSELEPGMIVLVAHPVSGSFRASQLGDLNLHFFNVLPARLTGLITLGEQHSLEKAVSRKEFSRRILSSSHPTAVKMKELCADRNSRGLLFRLNLLQLFVEAFGVELEPPALKPENFDASERLRVILSEVPSDELLEISFDKLAKLSQCTPRHLGRIFQELVGMSFRDKRAEIRLTRARELLATSDSKIIDVALESGFKSLSLFNLMFARRFGLSPGKWRQKQANNDGSKNISNQKRNRLRPAVKNRELTFQMPSPDTASNRRKLNESVRVTKEVAQRLQSVFVSGTDKPSINTHTCLPTVQ